MKFSLRSRWILVIAAAIVLTVASIAADAVFFSSRRLNVHYETIRRSNIPASHNGMSIVCFGDLEFGTYMDSQRLGTLVERINRLSPDTVIFLGDLYDRGYSPDEHTEAEVVNLLKSIRAPEGKFAVLGEMDRSRAEAITSDLTSAGFEVLDNTAVQLHHGENDYIDLVGFNVNSVDQYTVSSMYANLESEVFKLIAAHSPDIADSLPISSSDWVIGANAHNSQVRIPVIESLAKAEDSNRYTPGKHISDGITIYATAGVGTTGKDTRLFADPEILVIKLSSQE